MDCSTTHLLRLFHTVRHLRKRQILSQLNYRFKRSTKNFFYKPPSFSKSFIPGKTPTNLTHLKPNQQENTREDLLEGIWSFINQKNTLGFPPKWEVPEVSKLWHYNLHYFDYIWSLNFEEARILVQDWLNRCSPRGLPEAWEPYVLSLRLSNWCHYFYGKNKEKMGSEEEFESEIRKSIFAQAVKLEKNLETHLLGNHYIENLVSLCTVGNYFDGHEAERLRSQSEKKLRRELNDQILSDGMHAERSTMYHCRMLETTLMLLATPGLRDCPWLKQSIGKMARALRCLVHPDHEIALMNDSAFDIYNSPLDLLDYVDLHVKKTNREVPFGAFELSEAGYYGYRTNNNHYIICDAGPIGPDHLPGHSHGDIFSFELSLNGHRVVVDSGNFDYQRGTHRDYCRSTRAHNTVEIEGADQCEFWDTFKVARRGRPHDVIWKTTEDGFHLEGWHDGYHRLREKATHRRRFEWEHSGSLRIVDAIHAERSVHGIARFHLHPDCKIIRRDHHQAMIEFPGGIMKMAFRGGRSLQVQQATYHPRFCVSSKNKAFEYHFDGRTSQLECQLTFVE